MQGAAEYLKDGARPLATGGDIGSCLHTANASVSFPEGDVIDSVQPVGTLTMKSRWIVGAAAALSGISVAPGTSASVVSPPFVNPANGHTYYLTNQSDWTAAAISAINAGGHLVTVNDAAENAWVLSNFGAYGGQQRLLWTGLTDDGSNGNFRYISGQTPAYTNWAPGEPNGLTGENYVAIYYPNHSSGGRWNDWGARVTDPIGLPFNGVVEVDPGAPATRVMTRTDNAWLGIAPVGNQTGQPIGTAGSSWESTHVGWQSDLNFSTSGWTAATANGSGIWTANQNEAPAYFRRIVTLSELPSQVMMIAGADDDVLLYINGQLVVNDASGQATNFGPTDITRYLRTGDNLFAAKVQNTGGPTSFTMMAFDTVPEPAGTTVIVAGAAALLTRRRRQ